jgi:hypothetical protein
MSLYKWVNREIIIRYFCLMTMFILVPLESLLGIEWTSLNGPTGGDVTSFFIDHDTTLWIGTGSSGGVYVLQKGDSSWVERNSGIGISHVYKLIEVDNIMYCEVRRNEDLENRNEIKQDRYDDFPDEDKIENLLKKWFYYDSKREKWIEFPTDNFEYEIVVSEYENWYRENQDRVKKLFRIEEKSGFVTSIKGGWFSGSKNHFPPDTKINHFIYQKDMIFLYGKSGLYKFTKHSNLKYPQYSKIIDQYKITLKETIDSEWIGDLNSSLDKSEVTQGKYDSTVTMFWDYYNNFSIFEPVITTGMVCTDPKQIIHNSIPDTNFVEWYDYEKEETIVEKHPIQSETLVVKLDNSVWIYDTSGWETIFDGYLNYFNTGENYTVSHLEQISQDSILIFSEGSIYLYSDDTLGIYLDEKEFSNSKTGSSVSPYYVSCNVDNDGVIWSLIKVYRSYWLIRFKNIDDDTPLFIKEFSVNEKNDRNISEYQIYQTLSPHIFKDNSGILWLFGRGEIFQIGSGYDRDIKYSYDQSNSYRKTTYIPRQLVSKYGRDGIIFLKYGGNFKRPETMVSWEPILGWSTVKFETGYYYTSVNTFDTQEIFLTTGYGPVVTINYCNHLEIMRHGSPGLVTFKVGEQGGWTMTNPPNRWVLCSYMSNSGDLYIGTSGSGVFRGSNSSVKDMDKPPLLEKK